MTGVGQRRGHTFRLSCRLLSLMADLSIPSRAALARLPVPAQWVLLAALSGIVLLPLELLHLPAALLLGPMVAAIALGVGEARIKMPAPLFMVAQAVIGCLMAKSLPGVDLRRAGHGMADLCARHRLGDRGGGGARHPADAAQGAAGDDGDLGLGAGRVDGDGGDGRRVRRRQRGWSRSCSICAW